MGARLTVDDGPRVDKHGLPRLVHRFCRGERSRTTPGNGLGLGLVAAMAEPCGGRRTRGRAGMAFAAHHEDDPMQQAFFSLLTILSGGLNPVQSGMATGLVKALGRPFLVAVISLGLSLACALLGALFTGQLGLTAGKAADVPWWGWLAGLGGFGIFIARPYAAPALGAATFTGLAVTASIACSVLLDNYGWLGFQQHAAGWGRLAGAALMIAGVAMVSLF